jgi:integrase/recombinase XerD
MYAIEEYLDLLRLTGVSERHIKEVYRTLKNYKKYILSEVDYKKSIQFFSKLQNEYSTSYYRKQMYQLIRFLKFLKIEWVDKIALPKEPVYSAKRITKTDIENTLFYFKDNVKMKALLLLGSSSGCRALELYQLTIDDIDIPNRRIHVKHEPSCNKTTKTKLSRVAFFSGEAQKYLQKYIEAKPKRLFPQKTCERAFNKTKLRVKDLRKYFSQEWDRRGGPTSIKKILMGHSLNGDVDLKHYNAQSEEDLKQIYDRVMLKSTIICRKPS